MHMTITALLQAQSDATAARHAASAHLGARLRAERELEIARAFIRAKRGGAASLEELDALIEKDREAANARGIEQHRREIRMATEAQQKRLARQAAYDATGPKG